MNPEKTTPDSPDRAFIWTDAEPGAHGKPTLLKTQPRSDIRYYLAFTSSGTWKAGVSVKYGPVSAAKTLTPWGPGERFDQAAGRCHRHWAQFCQNPQ